MRTAIQLVVVILFCLSLTMDQGHTVWARSAPSDSKPGHDRPNSRTYPLQAVAGYPADDVLTGWHVMALLSVYRIPNTVAAGVGEMVFEVPGDRTQETAEILKHDAQRRGYAGWVIRSGRRELIKPTNASRSIADKTLVLLPYAIALKVVQSVGTLDVSRLLASKEVRELSREYGYLDYISARKREILGAVPGEGGSKRPHVRLLDAYEVEIVMKRSLDSPPEHSVWVRGGCLSSGRWAVSPRVNYTE